MTTIQLVYIVSGFIALLLGGLFLAFIVEKSRGRKMIVKALNMSLFLIRIPRDAKEDLSTEEKKNRIAVMEQFLSSLGALYEKKARYGQPYIVLEMAVPFSGSEISFYVSVPKKYENFLEKQIYGFYPKAIVQKTEDYNIFNPEGESSGGFFKLDKNSILPIKTYKELEIDPLENLSTALSKIAETGDGGAVQIVLKSAGKNWAKFGLSIIQKINQGQSFKDAIKNKPKKKPKKDEPVVQQRTSPVDEEIIKSLQSKISKTGFEVNIRLLFSSKTKDKADELLSHLSGSFQQFGSPNLNSFKLEKMKKGKLKKLFFSFSFRLFERKQRLVLNSEEIASIFHFPLTNLSSPKLKWLKSKESIPPTTMPKEGIILGKNIFRGEETEIRMTDDDRRRHFYIVGQTGTGKTTLALNMLQQDILAGKGVCYIDPHGQDIEIILGMIPPERAEDVIYFNPGDLERPMGLNMLEYDPNFPEQKTFLVNEMISIFRKIFPDSGEALGPMFQQYMRGAMLLAMDDVESGATLLEVPKVLADTAFRKYKLSKTNNIVVKDFWEKEAEKAGGEASLANFVPYITSKVNIFLANDIMRPILCQQKSAFDFRKIMDEKKIFLANLSKGRLGDLNSYLLGLIIVGKFLMAAFSRVDIGTKELNDFYLYIDEFQNFTTDTIATILSEARKFKLNLILAHQFIGQLEDKIKDAVFGNVGSMAVYRVGAEDAEFLVKQFEPVFDAQDLLNIDNYNAYVKLLINNMVSVPFNMKCSPKPKANVEIAAKIKELSRLKYGREKSIVDKEIFERSKISNKISSPGADTPPEDLSFR
ncbi:MAG: hypothetical protein V1686_00805 [Patescibacteria group bacterium]